LLSEANHRINNNLQLIIILIHDQLIKMPVEKGFELTNILKKIDSIAALHRHLYKNADKSKIDTTNYLKEITINFNDLFNEKDIKIVVNIESFLIATDVAMYLGLLLSELYINSLKHAFKNQDEKIISFDLKIVNGEIQFFYADNGNQIITKIIKPKLIDKLCRQLKINYAIAHSNGFSFSFKHKLD